MKKKLKGLIPGKIIRKSEIFKRKSGEFLHLAIILDEQKTHLNSQFPPKI